MKTTIDLPDELVRELKIRAIRDGQKLKDAAADAIRAGLASKTALKPRLSKLVIKKDKKTGLPVIMGGRPALPGHEVTPDRIHEILLEQEIEWFRESS